MQSHGIFEVSHNPSKLQSRPRGCVVPTQDSHCAQCVPAACAAHNGFHLQWNMFPMKMVDGPASVLVTARDLGFDGLTDPAVRFDPCIP